MNRKTTIVKDGSTLFLRLAVLTFAAIVLVLCVYFLPAWIVWDKASSIRPLLIGMYVPAMPFFIAVYQAWKLLNYIDKNKAFSKRSIRALKNIKYCGIAISVLYAAAAPYIYHIADRDDALGVLAIALVIIFASAVVAALAGVLQKLMQNAVDIKSENDLTV